MGHIEVLAWLHWCTFFGGVGLNVVCGVNHLSAANACGECGAGSGGLASMRGMMEMEYRAAVRMVAAPDFIEGVRCSAPEPVSLASAFNKSYR